MLHRLLTLMYLALMVCFFLALIAGFVIIFASYPKLAIVVIISILAVLAGSAVGDIQDDEEE